MNRERAWTLLCEYTASESLRKHALAVEAAMRHYARQAGADEETWALAGLLHDFDYERWPNPPDHTREGARILREHGVNEEVIGAILAHADWNVAEYPRDTPIRRTLFAVDELCGFIMACALVRPDRLTGLESRSVRKKLKTPAFAASVSRLDIDAGAALLEIPLDDHISNCVHAMRQVAQSLGLAPGAV
jgi:putative nucleotidyltransferase with HDIG domain